MKLKCNCTHTVQDELHGKGIRIANMKADKNKPAAVCTVCNKEHKLD